MNNVVQSELEPIRARRKEYEKNIPEVYRILQEGSIRAEKVSSADTGGCKSSHEDQLFRRSGADPESGRAFRREQVIVAETAGQKRIRH